MLAISRNPEASGKKQCSPNILPCRVRHDGPVTASKRYWDPKSEEDGTKTAYFRGRKLRGREMQVPEGYRGVVLNKSARVLQASRRSDEPTTFEDGAEDEGAEDEDAEEPEDTTVMDEVADFDHFTVWSHETLPDEKSSPHMRGIAEWMEFAQAIHSDDRQPQSDDAAR